jgi:Tfp pilus assembly protein PilV
MVMLVNASRSMRKAIAMIELIVALVIIGITLSVAPLLMSQATQSGFIATQQEGVSAAAAQLDLVLTRNWDEADANQSKTSILTTTYAHANNAPLRNFTVTTKRPGMDQNASRINVHLTDATLTAASTTLSADGGDSDDVDDFNGNNYTLAVYLSGTANSEDIAIQDGDYTDRNISIATTVEYGDDVPRGVDASPSANNYNSTTVTFSNPFNNNAVGANTSNIKLVSVTLTSNSGVNELNKNISFSAFTCNIGSYETQGLEY